jgi:hypothetical protein
MSLCHGWGWQPPQTASHIHIRHIQRIWAHWYVVHGHTVSALHSYTHLTWLRFWGSGSLVESNDDIMSWLRLIANSNFFPYPYWTYRGFENIDMLSVGIKYQRYTVNPTILGSDFGFWVTCGVKMMWLCHGWGWQLPQTASHIHIRHV